MSARAPGLQQLALLVHVNPALMQRHLASFAEFHHVIVDWAARRTGLDPVADYQPEQTPAARRSASPTPCSPERPRSARPVRRWPRLSLTH
jgi:hypothetical protein